MPEIPKKALGVADGVDEGDAEGVAEGVAEGEAEGDADGEADGEAEGVGEGEVTGPVIGPVTGPVIGSSSALAGLTCKKSESAIKLISDKARNLFMWLNQLGHIIDAVSTTRCSAV